MSEVKACRLDNWSVTYSVGDSYTPPEYLGLGLIGEVYGHPKKEDGKKIRTSYIVKIEGRIITTSSGTVYKLGKINPDYRKWIRENYKKPWDWRNPIFVVPLKVDV